MTYRQWMFPFHNSVNFTAFDGHIVNIELAAGERFHESEAV
jgi:hypothetical protein